MRLCAACLCGEGRVRRAACEQHRCPAVASTYKGLPFCLFWQQDVVAFLLVSYSTLALSCSRARACHHLRRGWIGSPRCYSNSYAIAALIPDGQTAVVACHHCHKQPESPPAGTQPCAREGRRSVLVAATVFTHAFQLPRQALRPTRRRAADDEGGRLRRRSRRGSRRCNP